MNLAFNRRAFGYRAEGFLHFYYVERTNGGWLLTITRATTVAGVRVTDQEARKEIHLYDHKADAVAVAREFEALGEDYKSENHGHRERFTEAVTQWHASFRTQAPNVGNYSGPYFNR